MLGSLWALVSSIAKYSWESWAVKQQEPRKQSSDKSSGYLLQIEPFAGMGQENCLEKLTGGGKRREGKSVLVIRVGK